MNMNKQFNINFDVRSDKLNFSLFWLTGFADAESSFAVNIFKSGYNKLGWAVQSDFSIELHIKDLELLQNIKSHFGVGSIRIRIKNDVAKSAILSVRSVKDLLEIIIPHFDKYPLLTQKRRDFLLFKEIVIIMNNKQHLTLEGLEKIVSLRMAMTKVIPENLKLHFAHISKSNFSLKLTSLQPNLEWFVDGDGCFFVNQQKNSSNNTKETVYLKFQITQHLRDKILMENLIGFLGCGRIQEDLKRSVVNFIVTKHKDIAKVIIPIFNQHPLMFSKHLDYKDFCIVSTIMKKSSLTSDDYKKIESIKSGMNKGRNIDVNTLN